ncbi:hypothetical protein DN068_08435 [Taibaiella soli]|uniref:Uncharacterized protein n=1 Tax=Taibaiella soli TaxID=1649169 RepID=A0A2W2B0B2_9BACT|nr:hypothetical protein DN068_08435 [Taibaiella soli]
MPQKYTQFASYLAMTRVGSRCRKRNKTVELRLGPYWKFSKPEAKQKSATITRYAFLFFAILLLKPKSYPSIIN